MSEPTAETTLVYPPTERKANEQIIVEFQSKPNNELTYGDHIRCEKANLADCILISRNGEILSVIGCKKEDDSSKWYVNFRYLNMIFKEVCMK